MCLLYFLTLDGDEGGEGDEGDEGGGMTAGEAPEETHPKVDPRWPTRVFATGCIKKIITVCQSKQAAHFDLVLARERRQESGEGKVNSLFDVFTDCLNLPPGML